MSNDLRQVLFEGYATHYARVGQGGRQFSQQGARAFVRMYAKYLNGLPTGSRILDVGCGTGLTLQYLSQFEGIHAVGIDVSLGQIEIARRCATGAELVCDEAMKYLNEHPEAFQGLFCMDVVEHMATGNATFELIGHLYRAIKPGGFSVIRVPNAANLTGTHLRYADLTHERSFTQSSVLQLLEAARFEDITVVPVVACHMAGQFRLFVEHYLHRLIFRLCGCHNERVFTRSIVIAARRPL